MSSFVFTVWRGLYPPFLFFFLWGVAARIRARKWNTFDTLLLAFFLIFEFFSAFQVWMFYRQLSTSKRYLLIAIPLYLPFAAQGVTSLYDTLKKRLPGYVLMVLAGATLIATTLFNLYSPVVKDLTYKRKRIPHRLAQRAAARIRDDWRPASNSGRRDLMKCDQYQSGRAPLVEAPRPQTGYLCGGQPYPEFFRALNVPPDYVIVQEPSRSLPGYVRIGEVREEDRALYIHKRRELVR